MGGWGVLRGGVEAVEGEIFGDLAFWAFWVFEVIWVFYIFCVFRLFRIFRNPGSYPTQKI